MVHCLHYLRREPSVVLKTSLPVVEFNLLLAIEDQAHIKVAENSFAGGQR